MTTARPPQADYNPVILDMGDSLVRAVFTAALTDYALRNECAADEIVEWFDLIVDGPDDDEFRGRAKTAWGLLAEVERQLHLGPASFLL